MPSSAATNTTMPAPDNNRAADLTLPAEAMELPGLPETGQPTHIYIYPCLKQPPVPRYEDKPQSY